MFSSANDLKTLEERYLGRWKRRLGGVVVAAIVDKAVVIVAVHDGKEDVDTTMVDGDTDR